MANKKRTTENIEVDTSQIDEITTQDVWNVMDFYAGLYGQLKGYNNIPYDATMENNNLIDLNNNPKIPSYDTLRQAIIELS